jgi:hypothetical protein
VAKVLMKLGETQMVVNSKRVSLLGASLFGVLLVTTSHANSFTIENQGSGGNSASANFADPDDTLLQNFQGGSRGQSGPSLQFGTPFTTNGGQGASSTPLPFGRPLSSTYHN